MKIKILNETGLRSNCLVLQKNYKTLVETWKKLVIDKS